MGPHRVHQQILRSHHLFEPLSEEQLDELLESSQLLNLEKGDTLFIQGENVNHFRYFRDDTPAPSGQPLPRALQGWLAADEPTRLPDWENPAIAEPEPLAEAPRRGAGPVPLLFLLPGIMGSRLEADGERIWLAPLRLARGEIGRAHV